MIEFLHLIWILLLKKRCMIPIRSMVRLKLYNLVNAKLMAMLTGSYSITKCILIENIVLRPGPHYNYIMHDKS